MPLNDITGLTNDITGLTKDDILAIVGLASRRSITERVLSAAGYFGGGLLVGVGAALLLAPKSGRGLREDLGARFRREKAPEEPPEDVDATASGARP